jgi:hypothetical protein
MAERASGVRQGRAVIPQTLRRRGHAKEASMNSQQNKVAESDLGEAFWYLKFGTELISKAPSKEAAHRALEAASALIGLVLDWGTEITPERFMAQLSNVLTDLVWATIHMRCSTCGAWHQSYSERRAPQRAPIARSASSRG